MNRAIIGIGSNIEPERNIAAAVERIAAAHCLVAKSQFVETRPIGSCDQPDFLNGAVLIETGMSREALGVWLRGLETDLGRVRHEDKFAARPIDLDIVVWNGQVVAAEVYERDFLLQAVLEVAPDLMVDRERGNR